MSESIQPADRLARLIKRLNPSCPVDIIHGDPDRLDGWYRQLIELNRAASDDCPVVFNLAGGRKTMSLGGLIGLLSSNQATAIPILVGGTSLRVEFVDPVDMTQSLAPADMQLSLDQYVATYGYRELAPDNRISRQEEIWSNADAIAKFAKKILSSPYKNIQILKESLNAVLPRSGGFRPGLVAPSLAKGGRADDRSQVSRALLALAGFWGLEAVEDSAGQPALQASEERGALFLQGTWIEAYLYNALRSRFGQHSDIEIATSVVLAFDWNEAGDAESAVAEFDIAIMVRSQLHLIEAKLASFSARASSESGEKTIAQVSTPKRDLLGQFGQIVVVAPHESSDALARAPGAFPDRAKRAGVHLVLGRGAVEQAVDLIAKLVGAGSK